MNPRSNIYRALIANPGSALPLDEQRIYSRESRSAVRRCRRHGPRRSRVRMVCSPTGGHELGLRPETLALLAAPAIRPTHGFIDECMKGEAQFSLGFMKPSPTWPFGGAELVRVARLGRVAGLRRSRRRHRLRLRHESDGNIADGRPARRRVAGRVVRGDSSVSEARPITAPGAFPAAARPVAGDRSAGPGTDAATTSRTHDAHAET